MKILLINPPYQTLTSNFGVGHQVPLGLLMVGGPLIDAGHEVRLLDAEGRRLGLGDVASEVRRRAPEIGGHEVGEPLAGVAGIAYRDGSRVVLTAPRPPIPDLDEWRTGWELI